MDNSCVLKMENISKEYYGNQVLKDVSLSIKKGEIHALLGENGAGKSTLMNILFGMGVIHSTGGFSGDVYLNDEITNITSPLMAMDAGIGMVHQEFMLIPGFTVAENIKIGREISKPNIISRLLSKKLEMLNYPAMADDARKALKKVGLGIDEYAKIAGMPVGYMQFVEIAREIDKTGIRILVFDEPTAVLTETEAEQLLETMRNIADSGIAIIFITHRLDEVMAVCDNITILRDGQKIATKAASETNARELAALMVGREVDLSAVAKNDRSKFTEPALELKDFRVEMEGEEVRGLDLTVMKGEIFGIGGLAGQGKIGVCNGIMGTCEASGSGKVFGQDVTLNKLGDALKKKVAFVSEDRRGVGLLLDESIADNIAFTAIQLNGKFLANFGIGSQVIKSQVHEYAEQKIKELDIRCTSSRQKAGNLSGGNQQKVCLARALALEPELLLVAEPTRGIDIGAKKLVLDTLMELNKKNGVTVIMVSSELLELRSICDRISIITDGKLAAILEPDDSDVNFGLAMSGTKLEEGSADNQ